MRQLILLNIAAYAAAQLRSGNQRQHSHTQQYQHADSWAVNRAELKKKSDIVAALELKCDTQVAELEILDQQVMTLSMFLEPLTTANDDTATAIDALVLKSSSQDDDLDDIMEKLYEIYRDDYTDTMNTSMDTSDDITYPSIVKRTSELSKYQEQMRRLPDI